MLILAHRSGSDISYESAWCKFSETLDYLEKKSQTAREIISFVEKSQVRVGVLAVKAREKNGPTGKFGPFSISYALNGPYIFWDPDHCFQCCAIKSEQITGFYTSGEPKWTGNKVLASFPPMITLIHELGHAKQYIEDPGRFAHKAANGTILAGSVSLSMIENDNLKRHENPVCNELGLLLRIKYDDLPD